MNSMAEVAAVLRDPETRAAFRKSAEKRAREREVDSLISSIPDDQLDEAIKIAKEANEERLREEEAEKVAEDYKAAGRFMAEGFREETGGVLSKVAENSEKLDTLIALFKEAGVTV